MVAGAPPGIHQVADCLDVLRTLCVIYGFKGTWDESKTREHWETCSKECGWVNFAKYKLAAFFAANTGSPLPQAPKGVGSDRPGNLVGGRLGRFIDNYLNAHKGSKLEFLGFLASIKQSKKGMPRMGKETLKEAERAFILEMTAEQILKPRDRYKPLMPWSDVDSVRGDVEITLTQGSTRDQLRRTVKELLAGKAYTFEHRIRRLFPSTSANYIRSRKGGGAVGEILEDPELLMGLRRPNGYVRQDKIEKRGGGDEEIEDEGWIEKPLVKNEQDQLDLAYGTFWVRLMDKAVHERPLVEPVALAEPLKKRIITKGPPFTQTVLKSLWKFLHDILRKHPALKLIGQPTSAAYMLERLGRHRGVRQGYLSGDFKAATDNLLSWVSEEICEAIADELKLFPIERAKLIESLTRHIFVDSQGVEHFQTKGQLMGSITSFVVLCIANVTCLRWSCEIDQRRQLSLESAPIMVNGDDGAAKCREEGYHAWQRITSFMGFEESVGKTYFSKEFVEINSTLFYFDEHNESAYYHQEPDRIEAIKLQEGLIFKKKVKGREVIRYTPFYQASYVNMGLLTGQKRSGPVGLNDAADPRSNIGTRYRELMTLSPHQLKSQVHKVFVENHQQELMMFGNVPWALPEWIGGAGLLGYLEPTEKDLRIAQRILIEWKRDRPVVLTDTSMTSPWHIWQLASKKVPNTHFSEEKDVGTEAYTALVGRECVNLLFDSNVRLTDLYQAPQDQTERIKKALRHNAKLWKPDRRMPPAISNADLTFRPRYPTLKQNTKTQQPLHDLQLD